MDNQFSVLSFCIMRSVATSLPDSKSVVLESLYYRFHIWISTSTSCVERWSTLGSIPDLVQVLGRHVFAGVWNERRFEIYMSTACPIRWRERPLPRIEMWMNDPGEGGQQCMWIDLIPLERRKDADDRELSYNDTMTLWCIENQHFARWSAQQTIIYTPPIVVPVEKCLLSRRNAKLFYVLSWTY